MRRREGVTGVPGGAGPGSGQCSGRGWGPGLLPPPAPRLPPFLPLSGAQGLIRLKTMTARGDSSCTDKSATLTGPGRQGTRPGGDPASGRPGWQETGPAEFVLGTPWISFWSECTESRWESEPVEQCHPARVCPLSHPAGHGLPGRDTRRLCGGRCARCSSSRGHGGFQGAGTWHCVLRSGTVTAGAKPPPPGSAGRGTAGTPVLVAADQPFQRPARHGTVVTVSDALRAAPAGPGSALPLVGGRSGATSPQPPSPGRLRPREDKTEVGVPSGRPPAHSGFSPERSDGLVAGTEDALPAR